MERESEKENCEDRKVEPSWKNQLRIAPISIQGYGGLAGECYLNYPDFSKNNWTKKSRSLVGKSVHQDLMLSNSIQSTTNAGQFCWSFQQGDRWIKQSSLCTFIQKLHQEKKEQDNYLHGSHCQPASPGWGESSGRRKTVQTRQGVSSGKGNRCHRNKPTACWASVQHKTILNFDQMQISTCQFAGYSLPLKHSKYKWGDLYQHGFRWLVPCFYFWRAAQL